MSARDRARMLAAPLLLCSCTVGPDFVKPVADTPATFGETPVDVPSRTFGAEIEPAWWASFRDPELVALVVRLARQNLDLAEAAERVQQARAQVRIAAAQGLPRVDAGGSYSRVRQSPNGTVSLVEPSRDARLEFDLFQPAATASWELDLFGRVRRSVEAARAGDAAAEQDRRGVALSVVAELAQDYMRLRQAQRQEAILRDNVTLSDRRVALVRRRQADGEASDLEVAQAEAQLSSIQQDLPSLLAQEAALSNAIALLLAQQPRTLDRELAGAAGQPDVPAAVPIGLPADVIRRRPDVRQAEEELHAATARTGVAVADFYPDVSFSAKFGFESLRSGSLFDWASRASMLTPSVSLPIFQGGRLRGNLQLRRSEQRAAAIRFRSVVLSAWHDVDNALTGYARAQESGAATRSVERANARVLDVAQKRYRAGETSFLDVIEAQALLLASQNASAQANASTEIALVGLYKALGGGWEALEPNAAATAAAAQGGDRQPEKFGSRQAPVDPEPGRR